MNELPPKWASARVGELAEAIRGLTYKKEQARAHAGDGLAPLIRATNIQDGRVLLEDNLVFVPEILIRNDQWLQPGDIVLASSSGSASVVGKSASILHPWHGTFGAFCIVLRPSKQLDARYFAHFIASPRVRARWSALAAGTNINNLKSAHVGETEVPLPPLNEQRRIVAAIEARFSRLDAAEESLRQARLRLNAYIASAIVEALAGDWPTVSLGDVTQEQSYGTSAKTSTDPTGVPVLRMGNIQDGRLDFHALKYLPSEHPDVRRLTLRPGDLLFNRTNSPELVGKSAVFKTGPDPTSFASYLIRVRLMPDCDPDWASLVINSPLGREYIARVRTQQVGQANVNGTKLTRMPIPLPPVDEQRRIIARLEEHFSATSVVVLPIERASTRSAALRRSILERAFCGELAPQDPADEPASVSLERIAADRKSATPRRRGTVTT